MQHPRTLTLITLITLAASTAHARLAAWYPLDTPPDNADNVTEAVAGNDAFTLGYDPDPAFSLITPGHPSARPGLGTSYLFEKGGALDLGGAEAVQPTDKFTIAFFFQLHTFDAFDRFLESQVTNTNAQDGIRIDTGGGTGNHVRVLVRDGGNANTQFQHPTILKNDGTWYFFAFRYDSDGIDNDPFQLTLVEVTGDTVDDLTIFDATDGNAAVINTGPIGYPHAAFGTLLGAEVPDNPNQGNHINAALDEFAFYDNADGQGVLTDAQLADVYNFGPSGVQLITSFTTDAASVNPGSPANLSWTVIEPFDTLTLDDGAGNITDLAPLTAAGAGTTAVSPDTTTTYTLRATRGTASNTSNLRILAGAAPDITSFTSTAAFIRNGGSVDLSWAVTGGETLTLDPGATDVSAILTTTLTPTETTTYTLSATNGFGTTTSEITVNVLVGPIPTHRYVATTPANDDTIWTDEIGTSDWVFTGGFLDNPILEPSPNTSITATYVAGGLNGASTPTFAYPEFTAEIWLRPVDLTPDHEVIFETGGGQNGIAALVTDSAFRFLGSRADERTLDITIPTAGLNLDDFLQLTISNSIANGSFDVAVRDTFGNVRTVSEPATGQIGNNGAGLFIWASGAIAPGDNSLGGRTELPDMTPEGMTGFNGEIAIVNIYNYLVDPADIQLNFDAIATTIAPPTETFFGISSVTRDAIASILTVTWSSTSGKSYDIQFSTDLQTWFDLAGPFTAVGDETTQDVNFPPPAGFFYIRVRELAP